MAATKGKKCRLFSQKGSAAQGAFAAMKGDAAVEDTQIIALYWARSEEAITATDSKYGPYCRTIAHNILNSREDTEECVNDTWLNAWNAMPPQKPNLLRAFLGRITRNLALDRYDYYHAQKRQTEVDALLSELHECIADRRNPYEERYVAEVISAFLRSQPEEKRNVFLRRYWYADSIEAIARRGHMSQSQVKSMLFRMRGALRAHLEKEGIAL